LNISRGQDRAADCYRDIGFHDAVDGQLLSRSLLDTGDGLAEEQVIK
jgi:hypothetical protein